MKLFVAAVFGMTALVGYAATPAAPAQRAARTYEELLNQNASRKLRIVDSHGAQEGKLSQVGTDYFCGEFSASENTFVRCYRFDAVRWTAVRAPGPDVLVIAVPEF